MMDDDYGHEMDYEAYDDDSQETQTQQTQSTQQASQSQNQQPGVDSHLWGYLQPVNNQLVRIDFWKIQPEYNVGRAKEWAKIVFPGFKVSNKHAIIKWNGSDQDGSVVVIDKSSNGTFINGQKIGRDNTRILRDGNEIAFGTPTAQHNNPIEDYRFIYRHIANGQPTTGFYAYYDVGTELGKGSFATVMKAINRQTGIWYAVKMIKDKKVGNQQQQDGQVRNSALIREISIMERLKHDNICELKEVFMEEDSTDINLVLELVEGGDLLEYILSRGGLSEEEAKHITHQMCSALAYIHSQGIAHRDLKPENVLLTKANPPVVKIADFGLAKIADSLTMLRTMCGTPNYLAPEVVKQQNEEGYDHSVDSWSVGVILFSMLTNSSPFIEDETQRDIRVRIAERSIDWTTLDSRRVSPECEHFIRSLLREDPVSRMTLTDSLQHPWLKSYQPVYAPTELVASGSTESTGGGASAGVTHDFLGLQIQPAPLKAQGSRAAPLQRRSQVLSQAAEEGRDVPEPTPEMIASAAAKDQSSRTRAKRGRANLAPLQENSEAGSSNSSSSSSNGKVVKRPRLRSDK